jgi:hypothetical protein
MLPPFRWKLAEVPFGIDLPYWIEDPDFDLDFHIRETAVPPPGDDPQIAETVARIASRPLDRSRPLWELYLVHGLSGGRVGLLTKIHITVLSYRDHLDFGIVADRDQVEDTWSMMDGIHAALDELEKAVRAGE